MLLFPCGKLLEKALPDWGVAVAGTRHSLNPGAWTFKEQMFATITYNMAIYTTNSYGMILVQRSPIYYGLDFISVGYQLMLTLFVQLMGVGFAGYLRRFSVYPVKALWPTVLPVVAMNRALARGEAGGGDCDGRGRRRMSRYRFFAYAAGAMFVYYWLPGYLFTALSQLNWMTWPAPDNVPLAVLTGSGLGLGLFNPLTTLDWNVATSSYAALAQPFFSTCTMYVGSLLGGAIILGLYYSNHYHTAHLPINSATAWANDGTPYQARRVVAPAAPGRRGLRLDPARYQSYSPPFYSAGFLLTVGANFAFYPVYFVYTMGSQWRTVSRAYVDLYRGLRHPWARPGRGAGSGSGSGSGRGSGRGSGVGSGDGSDMTTNNNDNDSDNDDAGYVYGAGADVHARAMARYPEVPDWWFLAVLAGAVAVAIVFVRIYPVDTPVWLVFLLLGLNLVFAVPLSLLSATTGTNLGLGSLVQVLTGYLLPGSPGAFLFGQTLGSWALAGHGDNYVQDQKMALYCKIAPRAVFRSQMAAVVVTCFVAVATQNWVLANVPGLCTPDQPSRFTCAADGAPLFASSLMWGLLGSDRMFGHMYPLLRWCFLIGAAIAVGFLAGQAYGPRWLPRARDVLRRRLPARVSAALEATLFPLVASLQWLNPVLVIQGIQHWAPSNMAYKTPGFLLSFAFMYWMPRRHPGWWARYNYTLSAALSAGLALSAIVIFFAVGYRPHPLNWWGNTVSSAGVDGRQVGVLPIPPRGYFGPEKGTFP